MHSTVFWRAQKWEPPWSFARGEFVTQAFYSRYIIYLLPSTYSTSCNLQFQLTLRKTTSMSSQCPWYIRRTPNNPAHEDGNLRRWRGTNYRYPRWSTVVRCPAGGQGSRTRGRGKVRQLCRWISSTQFRASVLQSSGIRSPLIVVWGEPCLKITSTKRITENGFWWSRPFFNVYTQVILNMTGMSRYNVIFFILLLDKEEKVTLRWKCGCEKHNVTSGYDVIFF